MQYAPPGPMIFAQKAIGLSQIPLHSPFIFIEQFPGIAVIFFPSRSDSHCRTSSFVAATQYLVPFASTCLMPKGNLRSFALKSFRSSAISSRSYILKPFCVFISTSWCDRHRVLDSQTDVTL